MSFRDQIKAENGLYSLQTIPMTPNNSYWKELSGKNHQR
jgi:hypothetical protein